MNWQKNPNNSSWFAASSNHERSWWSLTPSGGGHYRVWFGERGVVCDDGSPLELPLKEAKEQAELFDHLSDLDQILGNPVKPPDPPDPATGQDTPRADAPRSASRKTKRATLVVSAAQEASPIAGCLSGLLVAFLITLGILGMLNLLFPRNW